MLVDRIDKLTRGLHHTDQVVGILNPREAGATQAFRPRFDRLGIRGLGQPPETALERLINLIADLGQVLAQSVVVATIHNRHEQDHHPLQVAHEASLPLPPPAQIGHRRPDAIALGDQPPLRGEPGRRVGSPQQPQRGPEPVRPGPDIRLALAQRGLQFPLRGPQKLLCLGLCLDGRTPIFGLVWVGVELVLHSLLQAVRPQGLVQCQSDPLFGLGRGRQPLALLLPGLPQFGQPVGSCSP